MERDRTMNGTAFVAKVLHEPPFSKMHPKVAGFFKGYLAGERVAEFGGKYVLNTHFPPYPSRAFDTMAAQFNAIGESVTRSLFSVTLAVTNRCMYRCWHCYNAGRNPADTPLAVLKDTVRQLQALRVVHVTLTGGEPLLREDLEEVAGAFDDSTYLTLNTTGWGLSGARARALKEAGLFALGVSLDSTEPEEHDRMRGHAGAFDAAVAALRLAEDAGLYPYIISVGTHDFLRRERFERFMRLAADLGAREVHLLEPSATGNLAEHPEAMLDAGEQRRILEFQREAAQREDWPILSTFLHLESPGAFGCGAGLTHLYIDGSGEVCPCNLVPLSFGNVAREPLTEILERMGAHFVLPRTGCVGKDLAGRYGDGPVPLERAASAAVCEACLPKQHPVPRFFEIRREARGDVGPEELKRAYNRIHGDYDAFWLSEAGKPVLELVERIPWQGRWRVFEAGCGTGYGTAALAAKLEGTGELWAADLSEGMLEEARARLGKSSPGHLRFLAGDALQLLGAETGFDLVFSSWVLGYIPLDPFFGVARHALRSGGRLAFVVHKENSPREPLELFWEIVAEEPSVLEKRVAFDFPKDLAQVERMLRTRGFEPEQLWEGSIEFRYRTAEEVLEHLLKSGAGTAFYDAVDPARREALEARFLAMLAKRHSKDEYFPVVHEYIACVAGTMAQQGDV